MHQAFLSPFLPCQIIKFNAFATHHRLTSHEHCLWFAQMRETCPSMRLLRMKAGRAHAHTINMTS